MYRSPLSTRRCTTGGTSSRRWIVAALVVALIGLGGSVFAATTEKADPVRHAKPASPRISDEPEAQAAPSTTGNDNGSPRSPGSILAPPSNDECTGAIVVPPGPSTGFNTPPVNALDATPQGGDEGLFPAACNASGTDYTVWYSFTPTTTTLYTMTTCAASGAVGNTVADTVLALFTSTGGACPAVTNLACNDSSPCASGGDPSTISAVLNAGETYFIVAGHWIPDGALTPSTSTYVVNIKWTPPPANDSCDGSSTGTPIPIPLNQIVQGTTAGALNNFQTPATAACYAGIGQTPTTAPGRDAVFTFTAPATGKYSIRQVTINPNAGLRGQNPVIYVSDSCPAAGGEVNCLAGANRPSKNSVWTPTGINTNQAEEITCMEMTAGQMVYVFFDDGGTGSANGGGPLALEATECTFESEPNDTPATANPVNVCAPEGHSTSAPSYKCLFGPTPGASCVVEPGSTVVFADNSANTNAECQQPGNALSGQCFPEAQCVGGPYPGTACSPVCVGGTAPGTPCTNICIGGTLDGKACSSNATCTGGGVCSQCAALGGTCTTSGACGACVGGPFPGRVCTNNALCTQGTNVGTCNVGTCDRVTNEGDLDFWSLQTVAGSKVYAAIDAPAANEWDWRMRITSSTETLGFDEDDGTSRQGSFAPTIAGAKATGAQTFVKVSRTAAKTSEPYRLYAVVQPPIASAQSEDETDCTVPGGFPCNDLNYGQLRFDGLFINSFINNPDGVHHGYVKGNFYNPTDGDCFLALANKGDDLEWFGDSNPTRVTGSTVNSNPQWIIYDANGAGISNFVFTTGASRNIGPFTGNAGLNAITPQSTSFFQHWRATYTGMFQICAYPFPAIATVPRNWAGSLTANCGPMQPAGPGTTTSDVTVTKTIESAGFGTCSLDPTFSCFDDSACSIAQKGTCVFPAYAGGPVATSAPVYYRITVRNIGSEIAQKVQLVDNLPPELSFLDLVIDDGFGGNMTGCLTLPTPGTADAPVDCTSMSVAPGDTVTYIMKVKVNDCIGGGLTVSNTATIFTISTDPDPSNNEATVAFVTADNTSCLDLACDASGCVTNGCTVGDHCEAGVCVATALNCDDNSVCTNDSCDFALGCINDPTPGNQCDDGFICTLNQCDPIQGCVFPPNPCDDGNPCTDDSCDPASGCVHVANTAPCEDGNACTTGDTCGNGTCNPGGPTNCDDNSVCTIDSCDPALGCVHTAIVCDDGNVCTDDSCDPASGCRYTPNSAACNDGNACTTVDVCSNGACVGTTPVICTASDQCHVAGTCDPASGTCSNPNAPDGTTCNDGNLCTTGDVCTSGACGGHSHINEANPRTNGYYKRLCQGPHSGDMLTDADALCVASITHAFANFHTVADICNEIEPSQPNGDKCDQTDDDLVVLALNICRARVCEAQNIESQCGNNSTVGQSRAESDAILSSASRSFDTCSHAKCLDEEINTGRSLVLNTLVLSRVNGNVRLDWVAPYLNDGTSLPNHYDVLRRVAGSRSAFTKIGMVSTPGFTDTNSGTTAWEYEVEAKN